MKNCKERLWKTRALYCITCSACTLMTLAVIVSVLGDHLWRAWDRPLGDISRRQRSAAREDKRVLQWGSAWVLLQFIEWRYVGHCPQVANAAGGIHMRWVGACGLDSSGSGYGPMAGPCKHGNEPSGSIKAKNFLTCWVTVSFSRRTLLH